MNPDNVSNIQHSQGIFIAYWAEDMKPAEVIQVLYQFLNTYLPPDTRVWNVPIMSGIGGAYSRSPIATSEPSIKYVVFEKVTRAI